MTQKIHDLLRRLKIRQKILLLMVAVLFLSNGSVYLTTNAIYLNSAKDKAQNYSLNIIDQMIRYADSYFQEIESLALTIAYNQMIQQSLSKTQAPQSYEDVMAQKYIDNSLKLIVYSRRDLQIAVFGLNHTNTFYTSYENINPNYDFTRDRWYETAADSAQKSLFLTENPQNYYVEDDRKPVYTFLYKINGLYTQETIGYILMDIDKEQFDSSFRSNYLDIENTLILNADKGIIYRFADGAYLESIARNVSKNEKRGHFTFGTGRDARLVIFDTSEYLGWKIVNMLKLESLMKDVAANRMLFLCITLALFIAAVLASAAISKSITDPIVRLARGMETVRHGAMQPIEPARSMDEAGNLVVTFNAMITQIDQLMKKNETIELIQKETELKALQQQINPHFLYNTLENVIGLASERNYEKVAAICKNLGYMFRYNLNGQSAVLIKDELEQAKRYTDILTDRYEGKFKAAYDVNPSILSHRTIKFLLQPLIENAITHGFGNMLSGGLLLVSADWLDGDICFEVRDNGEGIPRAVLDELTAGMKQYDKTTLGKADIPPHLGIMNVYMRLKLFYGDSFRMEIGNAEGGGAAVRIVMPPLAQCADAEGDVC